MKTNKQSAALSSVFAAVFLTLMKVMVGVFTGSLGVLSEAAHSALDLCAAVITYIAVKLSDRPADNRHHYGHGKIESFSALAETILLLGTCGWIIYEAIEKVFFSVPIHIIGSQWGIVVMVVSIIVDYSRVKVLKKAAHEHTSQALEADALHFSSDILSSVVVIFGLICVWIGDNFNLPFLDYADPIAAFAIAVLVIKVSIKLGMKTIDSLLDAAPAGMREMVLKEVVSVDGVLEVGHIRLRPSGSGNFVDIRIGIDRNEDHDEIDVIVDEIRKKVLEKIPTGDIIISTFPIDVVMNEEVDTFRAIKKILLKFPNCANIHNIHLYHVNDKKKIAVHIELKENIDLKYSHELSHKISNMIQEQLPDIDNVNIYFQCMDKKFLAEDITEIEKEVVQKITDTVNKVLDCINCTDVNLYRQNNKMSTFLRCDLSQDMTVCELEKLSKKISKELKKNVTDIENVYVHFEPK